MSQDSLLTLIGTARLSRTKASNTVVAETSPRVEVMVAVEKNLLLTLLKLLSSIKTDAE